MPKDMENQTTDVVDQIDETAAADTLHPGAGSGGTESRAVMLSTFTQLLAQLGSEDLSDIFNQVQAQYGPNAGNGVGDNSASNLASIKSSGALPADPMPALNVKEDVEEMLGNDELSEDFKNRAETIFEAALNTRLTLERAKLEEEFSEKETELTEAFEEALEEQSSKIFEEITTKLNDYLDYAVAEWMTENQLAIDNGLRAEIAESFISGLHNLFAEHYVSVPEEKFDVMAEMRETIEILQNKLNETVDKNLELETLVIESVKDSIISEASEGLALTQSEKLKSLLEGVEFTDSDTFKKKAEIIKENYFSKKSSNTGLIIEETEDNDKPEIVPAHMAAYVDAISKSKKI